MACEDAYYNGDEIGRTQSAEFAEGHRPSAAGHNKHFRINEAFHEALEAQAAKPTPLKGTRLVIGQGHPAIRPDRTPGAVLSFLNFKK